MLVATEDYMAAKTQLTEALREANDFDRTCGTRYFEAQAATIRELISECEQALQKSTKPESN